MTYAQRISYCTNALTVKLLSIMVDKKTNVAFSADVTSSEELLQVRERERNIKKLYKEKLRSSF